MTRTGVKLDLDVGDLVSNAGRAEGAIESLTRRMKKAHDDEKWEEYANLAFQRDQLQGSSNTFSKNIQSMANNPNFQMTTANGTTIFKMDSEYASALKELNSNLKKLYGVYEEAANSGDTKTANDVFTQIQQTQIKANEIMKEAGGGSQQQGKSLQETVKAIGLDKITNTINDGLRQWASSLDRSGIIGQFGGGDILGGRLAEQRRRTNFYGGMAQTGFGAAGTIAIATGHPFIGMGLSAAGQATNTLIQAGVDKEANRVAYANLWDSQKDQAMNLAAVLGDPSKVRESWKYAADMAQEFGYSAEEGMEAMIAAARQGLDGEAVKQVFDYERRTGADRGTLSSVAYISERYNGGDVLRNSWAGLQASNMKPGQYNEYLRAVQRVMEDGISKGFERSSERVVQNLTMLSQMTNNNPLWQGENGARRLMEMNAGLESATGLQSTSDIVAYRAMRNITGKDNYIDIMAEMEKGVTPQFLREYMRLTSQAEIGDRAGIIERMRQTFGFNYNNAITLYEKRNILDTMTDNQLKEILNQQADVPDSSSAELDAAISVQGIVNDFIREGHNYWDIKLPESFKYANQELTKIRQDIEILTGLRPEPIYTAEMPFAEAVQSRQQQRDAMDNQYERLDTVTRDFFSEGLPLFRNNDQRADHAARNSIQNVLRTAIYSEDNNQLAMAKLVFDLLGNQSKNTQNAWNENNNINLLSNAKGIEQLLTALQRLIELTEKNGDVNLTFEDLIR
ncbi:MAG: hypothetical protein LBQ89_08245 [Treponema sp.]|jgi:hypothetical protein|nr:hypothetical protein [Treponema sp.]